MPTYNFQCQDKNCKHQFSKILPAGTEKYPCLLCESPAQKLLSAPAVHFSGSGFYATDSKNISANKEKETNSKKEEKTQ